MTEPAAARPNPAPGGSGDPAGKIDLPISALHFQERHEGALASHIPFAPQAVRARSLSGLATRICRDINWPENDAGKMLRGLVIKTPGRSSTL